MRWEARRNGSRWRSYVPHARSCSAVIKEWGMGAAHGIDVKKKTAATIYVADRKYRYTSRPYIPGHTYPRKLTSCQGAVCPPPSPPPCPLPGHILGSVHHARVQSLGPRWSTVRTCTSKRTVMNDDALVSYKNGVTKKHERPLSGSTRWSVACTCAKEPTYMVMAPSRMLDVALYVPASGRSRRLSRPPAPHCKHTCCRK